MSERPPGWRPVFRLPQGRRVERDVDEEIAFHLAMREERLRARGLDPDAARAKARERFGDLAQVRDEMVRIDREQARQKRLTETLEDTMKDVVFALRALRRAPGFGAAAILTLALGIGSAAAIFSVAYGVLLRPLPFPWPDRLVQVSVDLSATNTKYGSFSAPEYVDLARENRSFAALAAWRVSDRTLGGDGSPERIRIAAATASFFDVFGMRPALGRVYGAAEDAPGTPQIIVLGHDLWRRRFGGDPAAIGKEVLVDGVPRTVVGVMPPDMRAGDAEGWMPIRLDPARLPGRGAHFLTVTGRLKPGVTIEQARAELAAFAKRGHELNRQSYGPLGFTATARPLREAWFGNARPMMVALLGTVALLLLLAAVNVANLLLVRAEARQREIGVRVALGASRGRLVRQLLTESVLLAGLGALIGIPLAALGVKALLAINPGVVPPGAEIAIDAGVLGAVVAAVALAALVAGVAPALHAGHTDVRTAIASGSAGGGRRGGRLRSALVAVEVALAAVMLVGAGLVGRSFQRLLSVDPGFEPEGALVMDIALPPVRYDTSTKVLGFVDRALEGMRALPGVTSAAATVSLPLSGRLIQWSVWPEGKGPGDEPATPFLSTGTHDVFRALGIATLRGRTFGPEDHGRSTPVVVINEALARELWPREDPVGKRIRLTGDSTPWLPVIGVVRDVRPEALAEAPEPIYYLLNTQFEAMTGVADMSYTFVLRTAGDPASLTNAVRSVVRQIDRELAVDNVQTLEAVVMESVSQPRFAVAVLGAFGVSALVLAIVGVYGVLSYAMERRRREMAVRMALGSPPGQVRRLVVGAGLKLAVAGVLVGLAAALAGSRFLESMLYEVSPTDPATVVVVGLALLGAAVLASWLPARRATRVSPAEVLRGE